jgi:uncharacterized membrane protein
MELSRMNHSDSLLTALISVSALIISQISITIADESFMKAVTAVSSIVLCLTAVIKLTDLCLEKIPKWYASIVKRFSKPNPDDHNPKDQTQAD